MTNLPDDNEPITTEWLESIGFEYDGVNEEYFHVSEKFELSIWQMGTNNWICTQAECFTLMTRKHIRLLVTLFSECCSLS